MKKHYPPYFESTPLPFPLPYKLTHPYFYKKKIHSPPCKVSFENLYPPPPPPPHFILLPQRQGGDANYGFIYRNKYPHLHFIFTPLHFKGTFAIIPQVCFILTPPVYENLEKYPPAYSTPYYD